MVKIKTSGSPFSKVNHLGIVVKDLKMTIQRLESLGLGPFERFNPESFPPLIGEVMFRGKPLRSKTRMSKVKVGDVELEIFQPVEGESPWKEFLDSHGEGIHHIGFLVDDLAGEVDKLAGQGAHILQDGRWQGGGGGVYIDLGTGNIIIELLKF
jgi:methylmalonyl-CoA/ethylmalonyl-CoA epimerase